MARRKKSHEEVHENHERWLVTYADMITLLMVLFIVLFSMATIDARKFDELKDSLAGIKQPSPSVLEGGQSVIDGGEVSKLDDETKSALPKFDIPAEFDQAAAASALLTQQRLQQSAQQEQDNLEQVKQEIQSSLSQQGLADAVQFRRDPNGLVITIATDKVLFDLGKADIKPDGRRIIDALTIPLTHVPNPITVEGHTDDLPINSAQFPSNWELSTARSVQVLRYMVEQKGFPASRIGASGYAFERPLVPNDSAAHRAQNRRVEVVVHSLAGQQAVLALAQLRGSSSTTIPSSSSPGSGENLISDLQPTFDLPKLPERPVVTVVTSH